MNLLKKIYLPESKGDGIAVFYQWANIVPDKSEKNQFGAWQAQAESNHVEMFTPTDLTSIGLNKNSFVLRFNHSQARKRTMKFYLKNEDQVQQLARLAQITLGMGLKVTAHYGSFSCSQLIKSE